MQVRGDVCDMDGDNFFSQKSYTSEEQKKKLISNNDDGMKNEKDNMYTIFHALGKFLYNKSKFF